MSKNSIRDINVLIVDDNFSDRLVLKSCLESLGVESVQEAEDASIAEFKIANAKVARDPFDLIFVDVFLPKNSGIEVLKNIRNDKKFYDLSVVLISNSFDELKVAKAREYLVDDILVKPITMNHLNEKLMALAMRNGWSGDNRASDKFKLNKISSVDKSGIFR